MPLDSYIAGSVTGVLADVDSNRNLKVNLPTDEDLAGYAIALGEIDSGLVTGTPRRIPFEASEDYRMRVELDTLLDSEVFNYVTQNTGKHVYRNTTMTITWAGGALNTNGAGITTLNTGVSFQTYQYFQLYGSSECYLDINLAFTGTWAVTNTNIDFGFFTAATTTPFAPTDGIFFRVNSSGIFGVVNVNGTEQTTSPFKVVSGGADFSPVIGTFYSFIITWNQDVVTFWMDLKDGNGPVVMGAIHYADGTGGVSYAQALPFAIRHAIGGTVASAVMGVKVASYTVSKGGFNLGRSWEMISAMAGGTLQGQSGHTQGSLTNITNSMATGAGAALTNTTATAGTGLGGQFTVQPTLTAATDGILCSYLNPAATTAISGRQLAIKGVKISGIVSSALTGGPVVYLYSLAFGHNALSLATAEAATTKAPRRVALGIQQCAATAAIWTTMGADVVAQFQNPIVINPGEYVAVVAKNIGTVTSAGTITFLVTIDAVWV